jgi:uncharacterized cupin superfamily protein
VREVVNVFEAERARREGAPPGYEAPQVRVGLLIGATALGMTVYELPQGQSTWPYHYEYPCEEWLFVLEGAPTLRDPEGEHRLEAGDVVCFPAGPAGAHKLTNLTGERVLLGILSTKGNPSVAVYPDSNKVGIWSEEDKEIEQLFDRTTAVEYWQGEI